MSAKPEIETSNKFGMVWWLLVVAIVLGGVYANTLYASVGVFYRALAGLALTAVAVGLALQTESGRSAWDLAKEARVEVRKVVWPSRQETTQTTLIVVVVVVLVGLILWGLDSSLSWGIQSVIG
jgi:preprotein translocase subunit SecE